MSAPVQHRAREAFEHPDATFCESCGREFNSKFASEEAWVKLDLLLCPECAEPEDPDLTPWSYA